MRIRGLGQIQNCIRTVQNRLGANALILLYHWVTECASDPQRLVAPILARHNIPATLFVATATIKRPYEFWRDVLERSLLSPSLPARLEMKIGDQIRTWVFDDEPDPSGNWDVRQDSRQTSQKAYLEIAGQIRNLIPAEREKVLNQLVKWAGISGQPRPDHQTMTDEEPHRLTAGLITVGVHTVNHPVLSALNLHDQALELTESRTRPEPVTTFAYTYGRAQDYSRRTGNPVSEAGLTCACSNFPRLVNCWTDPLQLPRFIAGDRDGVLFEKDMEKFMRT